MSDEPNRLVLEGTIGPPTIAQTHRGGLAARAYLSVNGPPAFTILIRAESEEAARLSDTPSGATIRILGSLAWDPATKRFAITVLDLKQTAPPREFRATLRETIKDALPYST